MTVGGSIHVVKNSKSTVNQTSILLGVGTLDRKGET